jgi:hypothetical protein
MPGLRKRNPSDPVEEPIENTDSAKAADIHAAGRLHSVSELGWTREQTAQVRASLQAFDADWDAPGMEKYDNL